MTVYFYVHPFIHTYIQCKCQMHKLQAMKLHSCTKAHITIIYSLYTNCNNLQMGQKILTFSLKQKETRKTEHQYLQTEKNNI